MGCTSEYNLETSIKGVKSYFMNLERYYDYLHDVLSRKSIRELLTLYISSLTFRDGSVTRELIEQSVSDISKYYGYDANTFEELVRMYEDDTSPLKQLHITNNFILVTPSQGIPFSKKEFWSLLKRTPSIRGVTVFSLNQSSLPQFTCKFEDGRYVLTIKSLLEETRDVLTYKEILAVDILDGYFHSNKEVTSELFDEDVRILTKTNGKVSFGDLILETLKSGRGVTLFEGVDDKGEYENAFAISIDYEDILTVQSFYIIKDHQRLVEYKLVTGRYIDVGWDNELILSLIFNDFGFIDHSETMTVYVNPSEGSLDLEDDIIITNGECFGYYNKESTIVYLISNERLSSEVIMSNEKTYRIVDVSDDYSFYISKAVEKDL